MFLNEIIIYTERPSFKITRLMLAQIIAQILAEIIKTLSLSLSLSMEVYIFIPPCSLSLSL